MVVDDAGGPLGLRVFGELNRSGANLWATLVWLDDRGSANVSWRAFRRIRGPFLLRSPSRPWWLRTRLDPARATPSGTRGRLSKGAWHRRELLDAGRGRFLAPASRGFTLASPFFRRLLP